MPSSKFAKPNIPGTNRIRPAAVGDLRRLIFFAWLQWLPLVLFHVPVQDSKGLVYSASTRNKLTHVGGSGPSAPYAIAQ